MKLFRYALANPQRDEVLAYLLHYVEGLGEDVEIVVRPPPKSRDQEKHYHALIGDIAEQVDGHGKRRSAEWWKRILIDAFRYDTREDPDLSPLWRTFGTYELAPALNHDGFVLIGEQSRKFGKKLAGAFIDWLYAFGAEHGVCWTDPKPQDH